MMGDEVLARRSIQWKAPVFMAPYRTSISFDMQFLLEKKLFTGLFQESNGWTFLHPFEVASMLGFPSTVFAEPLTLPLDFDFAYRVLGNAFIPLQSGVAWLQLNSALNGLPVDLTRLQECWSPLLLQVGSCTSVTFGDYMQIVQTGAGNPLAATQSFASWILIAKHVNERTFLICSDTAFTEIDVHDILY